MTTLSFNGETKPWLRVLRGRSKPPFASVNRELLNVPGMPGAYLRTSSIQPLVINQPVGFSVSDDENALDLVDELAEWLYTDDVAPLEFSDEPGRFYYAVVQNTIEDFEKFVTLRQGTIQFLCPKPYKHGLEQTRKFEDDMLKVINDGTTDAKPVLTVRPTEPVTHVTVANEHESGMQYMRIGTPTAVDESPTERKTRILTKELDTLVGWTTGASVDNGSIAGTMKVKDGHMYTDDYGTGAGWHGPAVKASFPDSISLYDFALEVDLRHIASKREQIGRVEVAVLDASNNQIGKVMMQKEREGSWHNRAVIQAGDEAESFKIINNTGDTETAWHEFDGTLTLRRIGNKWSAYVGKYHEGRHAARDYNTWEDVNETFSAPIAQVQVYVAQYDSKPTPQLEPYNLLVDRYNANASGIPYVADENDEVIFDHKENNVFINGQSIFHEKFSAEPEKELDFGASFFPLHKGPNHLYTFPAGKLTTELKYRKRFI